MADVFISYKKDDAGRVIRLVECLRAEGLSVWWDHGIRAGTEWDKTIRQELDAARVIIAIWSESSVNAPWVKEEAYVGKARGILLPAKIDEVEPPLGFTLIQAADLVGWRGDRSDRRWAVFLEALRAILRGEAPTLDAPLKRRKRPWMLLWATGGVVAAALAAVAFWPGLLRQPAAVISPPASVPATPSPSAPPKIEISAAEQQLWDRAMAEKTRQGFQTYLLAYPNGAFAQRARDILLTCRTETRERWKPGPDVANQMLRGVGDTAGGMTPTQACEKAKSDVRSQAKLICETIVTNGGYRNAKWTVNDAPCDCKQPNSRVTVCIADLPYSCRWEMKVSEQVDVCG